MKSKHGLVCLLVLCMALAVVPAPARAADALHDLGVWEAFPADSPYQRMAYDTFFHDRERDIVLVILRGQEPWDQFLFQFEKQDGRWQSTDLVHFPGPGGELGTLNVMNSEDEGVPELAHSAFDAQGKGDFESFWFIHRDGAYYLRDALLTVPQHGTPLQERCIAKPPRFSPGRSFCLETYSAV